MSNKFFFVLLLGILLPISIHANRRARQLAKIDNALEELAMNETILQGGKKLDDFTVFISSQYDAINHVYIRNYSFVEDQIDIASLDANQLKKTIITELKSFRGFVDALRAVGGSMRYIYKGDTSFQTLTIELSYWDLNNVPYF